MPGNAQSDSRTTKLPKNVRKRESFFYSASA